MSNFGEQPAFPHCAEIVGRSAGGIVTRPITSGGMTLRQYYAGLAMQGLLANPTTYSSFVKQASSKEETLLYAASMAVDHADALIERLEAK